MAKSIASLSLIFPRIFKRTLLLYLLALLAIPAFSWSQSQELKLAKKLSVQSTKAPRAKSAQPTAQLQPQPLTFATAIANLKFREIGPANMGGRVDDFAVVESDPNIVYVGFASGGVWKTINGGTTWEPIFDKEAVSTIGCLAIAPSDPSIVWVGTGEVNNRQSSSWGNGIYKSLDAGRTWQHMGLAETHNIGSIAIHPKNPDVVYAAALGRLWGPNKERGIYKSIDGGRTWKQVLFVNEDTGVVNMVMDPQSPDTLYAAAYQRRRAVYGFNGSGPGSAIFKTTDGGAAWKKLTKGLPYENEEASETGRIGLAVCRRNPSIVYATVEHANGGTYRSEDKGETWTKMSSTNPRPMYYSKIRIDPNNDLRIWVLGAPMSYSEDGGKTFVTTRVRRIHGDYHAMWINPADSRHMIVGSDGGIHWSYDAGKTWDFVNTVAVGQFYEVGFDMRKPYWIYGGLQDNGSWGGPSRTLDRSGITNGDWISVGGGDGFYVQVDPSDPNIVYNESQDGYLSRLDLRTTESKNIRPYEAEGEHFRFQWCSPFVISAHDPKRLYYGAQLLFRSDNRGDTWTKVSGDLTTGKKRDELPIMGKAPDAKTRSRHDGVQEWPCITEIGESPINGDVLWVGTDDGCLQVTRDGGKTWKNVAERVGKVPKGTYVTRIVASKHAEGTAYVTFDGHRMNDFEVYVYATADYGETWKDISAGIPRSNGVVNVVREHFRNPNLLFVGTEYGAYASFDKGAKWMPLKLNLPTVPVDDIAIHPRENDLIFGTHGRSVWVMDDITPLEQMSEKVLASDLILFDIRPATAWRISGYRGSTGHKIFVGQNPPYGAIINYFLKAKPDKAMKIAVRISDAAGKQIREIEVTGAEAGINRTAWDLKYDPPVKVKPVEGERRREGGGLLYAPMVEPGTYTVTVLTSGPTCESKSVLVEEDPRILIGSADRADRWAAVMRLYELCGRAYNSLQSVSKLRTALTAALDEWKKPDAPKIPDDVKSAAEAIQKKAIELHEKFVDPPLPEGWAGPPLEQRPPTIPDRMGQLTGTIDEYTGPLTDVQKKEVELVAKIIDETVKAIDKLVNIDLPDLNKKMNQAGVPHIRIK